MPAAKGLRSDNKTKFRGVAECGPTTNAGKPFRAYFFVNKERIIVGHFATAKEAATARADAMRAKGIEPT